MVWLSLISFIDNIISIKKEDLASLALAHSHTRATQTPKKTMMSGTYSALEGSDESDSSQSKKQTAGQLLEYDVQGQEDLLCNDELQSMLPATSNSPGKSPPESTVEIPVLSSRLAGSSRDGHPMAHLHELEEVPGGRHLGRYSVMIIFLTRIVGTGIYSTPSLVYRDVGGSPALFFAAWIIGGLVSFSGLYICLELGSLIPRSGGVKVFLEYVYHEPKMMMSVIYNIYNLAFGFTITNAIIFGKYSLYSLGFDDFSEATAKQIGLAFILIITIVHGVSTSLGIKLQNYSGSIKMFLLGLIAFVGIYALALPESLTKVENQLHWHEFFPIKTSVSVQSFISAVLKTIFSLTGWHTAHTVANEIIDPINTLKYSGVSALFIVNICYMFINLAYLVVIPDKELQESAEMVGSILFEKLFGYTIGRQFLTFTVAISAGGNLISVLYGMSRMNQEIFREGFLPLSRFFASNWPFGSPFRALMFPLFISAFFLLLPSSGNTYDYIINLESYPLQFFTGLMALGIFIERRRYPDFEYAVKANSLGVLFMLAISLFLFVGPLIPKSEPEFPGFPNYAYLSIFILLLCGLYWLIMFRVLPRLGHYDLVESKETLSDGLTVKKWERIPISESEIVV